MSRSGMNRREFLESSGQKAAGAAMVTTAAGAVMAVPEVVVAATRTLSESQARALTVMARHLFPHDNLGDQYYAAGIEALDAQAAEDGDFAAMLIDGIAELDGAMGIPFVWLSQGNQLTVIKGVEGTDFFNSVRGATLGAVYGNDTVARNFGFEGSSVEYGGYLDRGFNDLGWLPELPAKG